MTKSERELRRATGQLIATMQRGLGSKEKAEEHLAVQLIELNNTLSAGVDEIIREYRGNEQ